MFDLSYRGRRPGAHDLDRAYQIRGQNIITCHHSYVRTYDGRYDRATAGAREGTDQGPTPSTSNRWVRPVLSFWP